MPIACVDWREADSGIITALYDKEVGRWSAELGWDTAVVVPVSRDQASGVALVTQLAPGTAHIAQLAVDPAAQGRGLGRLLVDAACACASQAGRDRITLLVENRNMAARRLYEASGFRPQALFVPAGGVQPLPLTSVAVRRGADNRA